MQAVLRVATVAVFLSLTLLAGDGSGAAASHTAVRVEAAPIPLTGSDWTNMSPAGAPAGTLVNMAMAYDSAADRMVVFGGYDFGGGPGSDKTWTYDFESNIWTNRNPRVHPPAGWLLRSAYDSSAQRTIMFGGLDGESGRFTNDTWAYDYAQNNWTNLSSTGSPSPRTRPGLAYNSHSNRIILFGGQTGIPLYSDETFSYDAASNAWTKKSPEVHPGARRSSMMAYDSKADRMVLFGGTADHGGFNDTWAYSYDTNTWTNLSPAKAPSPRYHGGFAYDSGVDRFVLYGGVGDGDAPYETWLYDYNSNAWTLLAPDHSPPPKALMGMAFDSQSGRTIMFGGNAGADTPGNETWAFTAQLPQPHGSRSDWMDMNPSNAPSGYLNMAMVYDSDADRMLVFGGYDGSPDGSNETWAYDFGSNTWTNLAPSVHPDAGWLDRAAYDSWGKRTIMFGGWDGVAGTYSNETWGFDFQANTWTNLRPVQHPSARSRQGMVFDAGSDRIIIFGGHTIEDQYSSETWAYSLAGNAWANMTSAVRPPGRRSPGMAYDSTADRAILFGGYDSKAGRVYNDTWAYDFDANTWTNLSPPTAPAPRFGLGFAYDSGIDRSILFGGVQGGDNVTWAYDFTNNSWSVLSTEHSPPVHSLQGMAYDTQSARTIMFGGGSGVPGNDTWALQTAESPPLAPRNLVATAGNATVTLRWDAPASDGLSPITGYRVYRGPDMQHLRIVANLGDVRSYADRDVTNGVTYVYRVSAVNAIGEGQPSAPATATPDGEPPLTTAGLSGCADVAGWFACPAVTVTLSASDNLSGVASTSYRVDGGPWQEYSGPFTIIGDGRHAVDFYSVDQVGNVETTREVSPSIDTVPPLSRAVLTGSAADSYWFRSEVTVSFDATDATSGVASIAYRMDSGDWQVYASAFTVGEGAHVLEWYGTDVAGNSEANHDLAFGVDWTAPWAGATLSGPRGDNGWYIGPVVVSIDAKDAASSVSVSYRIDGADWIPYTGSFVVSVDGVHTVEYRAVDGAGNFNTGSATFSIDATPPTAAVSVSGTMGFGGWYTTPALVGLSRFDDTSGVAEATYRIDAGPWQPYAGPLRIDVDGAHTFEFFTVDVAGNVEAVQSRTIRVDTTPPVLGSIRPSGHLTGSDVTLSWSAGDSESGIDHYEVSVDGGAWASLGSDPRATVRLSDGAHTVRVRAVDVAGNSAVSSVDITIDTNAFSFGGPFGGLPTFGILAVIVVIGAAMVAWRRRRRRT